MPAAGVSVQASDAPGQRIGNVELGIYRKFKVERVDESSAVGGKHHFLCVFRT